MAFPLFDYNPSTTDRPLAPESRERAPLQGTLQRNRLALERGNVVRTKQISARISTGTKDEVDEFLRARGLKQNRFIEDALRHYLRVLRSMPEEARVASSLVFTNQSFEEIVHSITRSVVSVLSSTPSPTRSSTTGGSDSSRRRRT